MNLPGSMAHIRLVGTRILYAHNHIHDDRGWTQGSPSSKVSALPLHYPTATRYSQSKWVYRQINWSFPSLPSLPSLPLSLPPSHTHSLPHPLPHSTPSFPYLLTYSHLMMVTLALLYLLLIFFQVDTLFAAMNSVTVDDKPPSIFQCQLKLFNQWYPHWSPEERTQLFDSLTRIDQAFMDRLNQQIFEQSMNLNLWWLVNGELMEPGQFAQVAVPTCVSMQLF